MFNRFKADLKHFNRKLLVAAVLLFCLSLILLSPIKGIEQIFFLEVVNKEPKLDKTFQESPLDSKSYLAANTLASLISQSDTSTNQTSSLEELTLATIQEIALLPQANPTTIISQDQRFNLITYIVQQGDTPSAVAASFGIKTNTLLWANNLGETSLIRPGDELIVLPIDGLIHRVRSGDTIGAVATRYKGDTEKIIAFNDLPADGAIQIGDKLIIPDGQMPAPVQQVVKSTYVATSNNGSRIFPYGQCTWYVAQKRYVPWSGNAKNWLNNAAAMGYSVCYGQQCKPTAGAIVSLGGSTWLIRLYGHVAYVESVQGDWMTISEMNYTGWAQKSVRTIKITDSRIRGYIY